MLLYAVLARRKSASEARRLVRASYWVSIGGIVVGIIIVMFLFLPFLLSTGSDECGGGIVWPGDWNDTDPHWHGQATETPEVTSETCHVIDNDTRWRHSLTLYAVRIVCDKRRKTVECPSARLSVCLSRRSAAAAAAGGFAAAVGRAQQISIDSCCSRAICGLRNFWSDRKEARPYYFGFICFKDCCNDGE